jgi:hypothetical protein
MSCLLLHGRGTTRFLAHVQGVVKMAFYGEMHFKQQIVVEFFVAEKVSVTNINKFSLTSV